MLSIDRLLGVALLCALFVLPVAGTATQQQPEVADGVLIEAARVALSKGELDDAEFLLEGVRDRAAFRDDLDFLLGSIALAREDWESAIARFRAMLSRNPDLPRVRLDLALAYFRAGQDTNAAYHFRLALGEEALPPVVQSRALALLDAIRRRKSWTVNATFAVAPDSNINAATSARLVELFGLPATLSEDARRTSGVGFDADLEGEYEARLAPDLRFRMGAALYTRTYAKSQFNDRTLVLRAGPRLLFEKFDLRPEALARVRHLSGGRYSRSAGLGVSGDWLLAPDWRLNLGARYERVWYDGFLGDGSRYGTQMGVAHALGRATTVQVHGGFQREVLDDEAYSWRDYSLGLSVSRELPLGFVLQGGPSLRWRSYGAPLLTLGPEARRDRTFAARIKISNRYVALSGFMPEITLSHEQRISNLDLYDYTRNAIEFAVVRSF